MDYIYGDDDGFRQPQQIIHGYLCKCPVKFNKEK